MAEYSFLQAAMSKGIISFTLLAKYLRPEIEKELQNIEKDLGFKPFKPVNVVDTTPESKTKKKNENNKSEDKSQEKTKE